MGSFGLSSAIVSSISSFQLAARSKKRFLEEEKWGGSICSEGPSIVEFLLLALSCETDDGNTVAVLVSGSASSFNAAAAAAAAGSNNDDGDAELGFTGNRLEGSFLSFVASSSSWAKRRSITSSSSCSRSTVVEELSCE